MQLCHVVQMCCDTTSSQIGMLAKNPNWSTSLESKKKLRKSLNTHKQSDFTSYS